MWCKYSSGECYSLIETKVTIQIVVFICQHVINAIWSLFYVFHSRSQHVILEWCHQTLFPWLIGLFKHLICSWWVIPVVLLAVHRQKTCLALQNEGVCKMQQICHAIKTLNNICLHAYLKLCVCSGMQHKNCCYDLTVACLFTLILYASWR